MILQRVVSLRAGQMAWHIYWLAS